MLAHQKEMETVRRERTHDDLQEITNGMRPMVLWTAVGMLLGVLGGLLFLTIVPNEWEAHALLRIGLIARYQNKIESMESQYKIENIESQNNIVERIRTDSFKQDISRSLEANAAWDPHNSILLKRTLKAGVVPGTDWVRISARSPTPEAAKLAVDAVANRLRSTHGQMAAPFLEDIELRLAYVESQVALKNKDLLRIEGETDALLRQKKVETAQVLLLKTMMDDASKQLNTFQRERMALLMTSKLVRTAPTAPVLPTFTSSEPVFPSGFKVLAMAVVLGGMFGCVLAWFRMRTKSGGRLSD